MSPLRIHQARLLVQALLWLAAAVALGLAFGDSLGGAVLWLVIAVAIGLAVSNRGEIAARLGRRRRHRRP